MPVSPKNPVGVGRMCGDGSCQRPAFSLTERYRWGASGPSLPAHQRAPLSTEPCRPCQRGYQLRNFAQLICGRVGLQLGDWYPLGMRHLPTSFFNVFNGPLIIKGVLICLAFRCSWARAACLWASLLAASSSRCAVELQPQDL